MCVKIWLFDLFQPLKNVKPLLTGHVGGRLNLACAQWVVCQPLSQCHRILDGGQLILVNVLSTWRKLRPREVWWPPGSPSKFTAEMEVRIKSQERLIEKVKQWWRNVRLEFNSNGQAVGVQHQRCHSKLVTSNRSLQYLPTHCVKQFISCLPTTLILGEGNGTPLQYSCPEKPMDRGTWWAAVHGVAKSRTRLSDFTFTFHFHALEIGNSNPLQCSCLENPRDGGAWWAAVYGVAQPATTEATLQQQQLPDSEGSVSAVRTQRWTRYPSAWLRSSVYIALLISSATKITTSTLVILILELQEKRSMWLKSRDQC